MKISLLTRMTAPIVVLSVVMLLLGVITAWYVQRLQQNATDTLIINVASIRAAEELEIGLREIRTQLNQFLLTGERQFLAQVPELRQSTDHWLGEAERMALTDREKELMRSVRNGYEKFFRQLDELADSATEVNAQAELRDLIETSFREEILRYAHEYLDFNEGVVAENLKRGEKMARRMVLGLLLLGTCGPLAGLLAGLAIAQRIRHSLVQLSVPVRDAAGKLREVVGPITVSSGSDLEDVEATLRELTVRIGTVVERLQQSQYEALRNEQLAGLGQLAAGVAHELRNPLQAMQLLVQGALAHGEEGYLQGRDLEVLQDGIERLKRSVQMFLDFARPPTLERRRVRLDEILRQTVELTTPQAKRQQVVLQWEPPAQPVWLNADAGQLRQLFLNLILNALDANPRTISVELQSKPLSSVDDGSSGIAVRPDDGAANFATSSDVLPPIAVVIRDDGCGIPPGLGESIFQPFVTSKETGVGLGLPICKRIVENHGGSIHLQPQAQGGVRCLVELPVSEEAECQLS